MVQSVSEKMSCARADGRKCWRKGNSLSLLLELVESVEDSEDDEEVACELQWELESIHELHCFLLEQLDVLFPQDFLFVTSQLACSPSRYNTTLECPVLWFSAADFTRLLLRAAAFLSWSLSSLSTRSAQMFPAVRRGSRQIGQVPDLTASMQDLQKTCPQQSVVQSWPEGRSRQMLHCSSSFSISHRVNMTRSD